MTRSVPQIFLSYMRQDKERVAEIYRRLAAAGFKPWMDKEDVIAGQQWKLKIERAIRDSHFFLACLSEHSVSKRGYLQTEIRKALEVWQEKLPDDIYLIPVLLERCRVPDSLSDFQWVEIRGDDDEAGWAELMKAIRAGLRARADEQDEPAPPPRTAAPAPVLKGSFNRSEVLTVNKFRPVAAEDLPESMKAASGLPLVTFPEDLRRFLEREAPRSWEALDDDARRFLVTLGTKLEPIVQVTPPTAVPLVIGFENLALGSLGENFAQICERASGLEPGVLRLLLTFAAMKTTDMLRLSAAQDGFGGVRRLLFTINLDPEMLDCPSLDDFLDSTHHYWEKNVIFEVNEKTTSRNLRRLKELQSDHKVRFCADDFNDWDPEVKKALRERVEMSKVDFKTFRDAMDVRGDSPDEAVRRIAAHRIAGKPLIVEGVENRNYLRFLHEQWPSHKYGQLFGQGYIIEPGRPWDAWTSDLRAFGLPGGHFLTATSETAAHVRV